MFDLAEAYKMLDTFAGSGAIAFDRTILDIDGKKRGFRAGQSVHDLRISLPKLVPGLQERRDNLIVRPRSDKVTFIQLDDLSAQKAKELESVACLTLETSPGNYQAWVAASDIAVTESKEIARRLRKGVGADLSASGATRVAGTPNYKRKYQPEFPTVRIAHSAPGLIATVERLETLGLLASPDKARTPVAPRRVSETQNTRRWPSYEISLMRANKRKDGMPDRSDADFKWCLTALTGGKTVEDTKLKLLEVSERAQERRDRDPGYIKVTVENAARIVEQNYGRGRS